MRFLYSRLLTHKPDTERDEDETLSGQPLDQPRFSRGWLPIFFIVLLLTNSITLLSSLYWASWKELRMKAESPVAYGKCETAYYDVRTWLTLVSYKQQRKYHSLSIQSGDNSGGI